VLAVSVAGSVACTHCLKMCCIIGTWVWDHLLREAWPGPLGVLVGRGVQVIRVS
jgi:hypothetical protein